MTGSNRRHPRCKRGALPTELIALTKEGVWCREWDLNPYEHCCSLAPQTSASANSATSATERYYRRLEGRLSNRVFIWRFGAYQCTERIHARVLVTHIGNILCIPFCTSVPFCATNEKSSRRCERICVAGVQGFEPQLSDSESDVLPLYNTPPRYKWCR